MNPDLVCREIWDTDTTISHQGQSLRSSESLFHLLFRRAGVRQEGRHQGGGGAGPALSGQGGFEYKITGLLEALVRRWAIV